MENNNYVLVNIWTSAKNKAIPGANVGHVSLQTSDHYISLWPGKREVNISRYNLSFYEQIKRPISNYFETRPPNFKQDYLADCICEALSEGDYRPFKIGDNLRENEDIFIIHKETLVYRKPSKTETTCDDNEYLLAIKLCKANIRIKLYSLDITKLHEKFREKSKLPGWSLIGSNLLTRRSDETAENCSSLAYSLLEAAGMYDDLPRGSSLETASVTSPDVLAKHVITFKIEEQANAKFAWTKNMDDPEESNLDELIKAYKLVGQNHDDIDLKLQFQNPNNNCLIL